MHRVTFPYLNPVSALMILYSCIGERKFPRADYYAKPSKKPKEVKEVKKDSGVSVGGTYAHILF